MRRVPSRSAGAPCASRCAATANIDIRSFPVHRWLECRFTKFQTTFSERQPFWAFVRRFVELTIIVPAMLLFEEFYGKGWRSSVRWADAVFATVAFAIMVIRRRPDLVLTAVLTPEPKKCRRNGDRS